MTIEDRLQKLKGTSPVIVVGCSRSGTSLVSGILQDCGVHMGTNQSGNKESKLFQSINRDMLDIVGVSWRCIRFLPPVKVLRDNCPYMRKMAEDALQAYLEGNGELNPQDGEWGWKDPRSSLTLPVWSRIFPKARVLHVVRSGREVAASLRRREDKRNREGYITEEEMAAQYLDDMRVWGKYVERIILAVKAFPVSSVICYEDLVSDPLTTLRRMLRELHLEEPENLDQVAGVVRPARETDHSRFAVDQSVVARIENRTYQLLDLPV